MIMHKAYVGQKIIHLECVDSTNNYTANVFKSGAIDSGTVILTDIQTNGRGQREKAWQSDAFSNLLVSVAADLNLWKINNIISLNHIVALALREFLSKHASDVKIKWPNDIMIKGRKVAGILIETQMTSVQRKSVIGFGVNINQTSFEAPRATSLFLESSKLHQPKALLFEAIDALNYFIDLYHEHGEFYLFEQYNEHLWKREEQHLFHFNEQEKAGKIVSSTMEGQLVIDFEEEVKNFSNGEVIY
ncbi:biotin--[acetyl-CoA-carboxylase] ligase [Brumimicrobium sp.]|uniref:biotin--[acetyl-CoA-carboxylase] ligase n=1 Tax=Brumimicrobium sp. TaxID=2029867 RepID=UPI003A9535B4